MNRLNRITVVIIITLLPLIAFGQAKVGTAGMQFLKVGVGTRAVGMGEAFTAVSDDGSALYYNPAGLIQLKNPEAVFSYIDYPAGLKFVFAGCIMPMPQISGVMGIQVTSLYTDDMVETTPEMPYGTGRSFDASDLAIGISYCQRLTDKFSVGATVKYLNERLADASASGWSADVGTFYTTGWKRINIGMIIQNFGPDMDFERSPFPLPINFKFGISMIVLERDQYKLLLAGEFVHPNDNVELYQIGAELNVMRMISFRLGKRVNAWERDSWDEYQENRKKDPFVEYPVIDEEGMVTLDGVSFGIGVQVPEAGVNVDYAWAGLCTLGGVHRFTLSYKFAHLW